jgi:hypothetical protein
LNHSAHWRTLTTNSPRLRPAAGLSIPAASTFVMYNQASSRENRFLGSSRTRLDQIFLQRHVYPLCMSPHSFYRTLKGNREGTEV